MSRHVVRLPTRQEIGVRAMTARQSAAHLPPCETVCVAWRPADAARHVT